MRFSSPLPALKSFLRNQSAVSALEFAMILPIMVTLYLGGTEVGTGLTLNRKVTEVTSTMADLVTQSTGLPNADISNIFDAASSIVAPYDAAPLTLKVSEIIIDSTGKSTVEWSQGRNTAPDAGGSTVSLPAAVATPSTWVIMSEVHYTYKPVIGYVMTGTYDLSDKFYLRPRLSNSICQPTCPPGG